MRRIAITTGDTDGIGLEVTLKALISSRHSSSVHYTIYRSSQLPPFLASLERKAIRHLTLKNLDFAVSSLSPAHWVQIAAQGCLANDYSALVTGPLSKETIMDSGFQAMGHTGILSEVTGARSLYMAFVGRLFNVLLITGHLPLSEISKNLTCSEISKALAAAFHLRSFLKSPCHRRPLALVGLNPHAGENGLIGDEEKNLFRQALSRSRKKKMSVDGPLVPDAAFLRENWSRYSVYVCPYHDQGLIPFKMAHGHGQGAHITMGLPFVRTSVDHGTAKDLHLKNTANPGSMIDAIYWANRLIRKGQKWHMNL